MAPRAERRPHIVCIMGHKGMGKTTLIERLVPELKARGYRVATVKRPPHPIETDTPGKDRHRHFHAGADAVLVYGATRLALVRRHAQMPRLEALVAEHLADADIVLAEGHKGSSLPKIEVFRAGAHPSPLYNGQPDVLALATDAPLEAAVPCLDLDDAAAVADFIARRFPLQRS